MDELYSVDILGTIPVRFFEIGFLKIGFPDIKVTSTAGIDLLDFNLLDFNQASGEGSKFFFDFNIII